MSNFGPSFRPLFGIQLFYSFRRPLPLPFCCFSLVGFFCVFRFLTVCGLRAKCDDLAVKFCAQAVKLVSEQKCTKGSYTNNYKKSNNNNC